MNGLNSLDKMNRSSTDHASPITVDDLLKKMRMGKQYISEIRMGDVMVPVRVLSADEVNTLRKTARTLALRNGGDETDENLILQKLTLLHSAQIGISGVSVLSESLLDKMSLNQLEILVRGSDGVLGRVQPLD